MPSVQLNEYFALREAGTAVEAAAEQTGIGLTEARLWEEAAANGAASFSQGEDIMAKKAKPEDQEVLEIEKPDYERAIRVLTNDVHPQQERNAKSRGELSAAWKVVEDECHVNKGAAKLYFKLTGMSDEKKDDFLRSLYGLMKTGGLGLSADLVDKMGDGEAPSMPIVQRSDEGAGLATLQ